MSLSFDFRVKRPGSCRSCTDYRYHLFRHDVANFHHLLALLDRSLQAAQQRYYLRGRGLFAEPDEAYSPLARDFEAERAVIVGNFEDTLHDCHVLLEEDKDFRIRYATVAESLKWYVAHVDTFNSSS